mgnify:CR=1 FL=1
MKNLQFNMMEVLPINHKYYNNINIKPDKKSIMRIFSEISSFKSGLPLNWDTTIWIRIPKNNGKING